MIADIESLKKKNFKFTSDYRDVWKEISGEKSEHLPPPEGVKEPQTNPIEMEDKYLKGLEFPAEKSDVVQKAKNKGATKRVLDVLTQLEDEEFNDMNGLLESVGDVAWDHD